MPVSLDKARDFVYANGLLWEQALFSYLFDGGSIERLYQCLLCYKNADGGWGHGLEHDIKCPDSHPLALEFLLTMGRDMNLALTEVLIGTVDWVESNRNEDGSLKNPDSLHKYPHAPWWSSGGQSAPDSITGNLIKQGICSASLAASTSIWAKSNLTLGHIQANDWLFMAYHAHDYYLNLEDTPENRPFIEATIDNIIKCAQNTTEKNYFTLFQFASSPDTRVAQAMSKDMLNEFLDDLVSSQREDGGWSDEHGLKHWQPYHTIFTLSVLRNYGRL
ncbi:hypothetical protein [Paenibacillus sp. FSL R7-0652]|uniref:Squalene cyclase C-terminal domain-containing protein n=1 Tax=Paenibacillus sp. AN1007 TaxID=3151385 RepID=A0AAU8NBE4_9BACL